MKSTRPALALLFTAFGSRRAFVLASLAWLGLVDASAYASEQSPLPQAVAFMHEYSRLENAFDPAFADLVHDKARIVMEVAGAEGDGELEMPAAQYKELMRNEMLLGSFQPYTIRYRILSTSREGERIRIMAARRTEPHGSEGYVNLLIGLSEDGRWRIFEFLPASDPAQP